MPDRIELEELEASRVKRKGTKLKDLEALLEDDEDVGGLEAFFGGVGLDKKSERWTDESYLIQRNRLGIISDYKSFVHETYPKIVAKSSVFSKVEIGTDAHFDYRNIERLATLIKAFLSFAIVSKDGRHKSGKITRGYLRSMKDHILYGVGQNILQQEPADRCAEVLRRVFARGRAQAHSKPGLWHLVGAHVAWLIGHHSLPVRVKDPLEAYGPEEARLIVQRLHHSLVSDRWSPESGRSWQGILQILAITLLCFQTGLRIGSVVASDPKDPERLGLACEDISFRRTAMGAWLLKIRVRFLKGFNTPGDRRDVHPWVRPMKSEAGLDFESAVPLLLLLISRKKLKEQGINGKIIESVDQLVGSNAEAFVGCSGEPLFRVWDGRGWAYMGVALACGILRTTIAQVGLPLC
ncbi:unnamed protein product [Parajaminaea phylloscopi]